MTDELRNYKTYLNEQVTVWHTLLYPLKHPFVAVCIE